MSLLHPKAVWLTYLAAACFLGTALYYLATGDLGQCMQALLAAAGIAGLRPVVQSDSVPPAGRSGLVLLTLLLAAGSSSAQPSVCDCTVKVGVPGRGGSGVVVARQGDLYLATTADHVTTGHQQATLTFRNGRTGVAQVCSSNPQADVALLCFRCAEEIPYCGLGDDPQQGQPIWQCGYPAGRFSTTAGYARGTERGKFTADMRIESGDSGGGFFDTNGRLVAISTISIAAVDPFTRRRIGPEYAGGPAASLVRAELARGGCGVGVWAGICGPGGCSPGGQGGQGGGTYKQPAPQMPVIQPPSQPAPSLDQQALRDLVKSAVADAVRSLPAGPPGPAGPQGPAGPAGIPGAAADPARLSALEQRLGALESKGIPSSPGPTRVRIEPVPK